MSNDIGRGVGASPAGDFFPLSGATSSSPAILITSLTATAVTVLHTADAFAQDIPIIYVANNSAAPITAYLQLGGTATTLSVPTAVAAGAWTIASPGTPISGSGIVGMWATASTGLVAYGGVNRTYTATA